MQCYFPIKIDSYLFLVNVAVPSASQMDAIESRDFPKVVNICAILAFVGRVGKSNMPSWVAVMVVFYGRITIGHVVVAFTLRN